MVNKKLAELYVKGLLSKFKHPREPKGLLDPWWWPSGAGMRAEDWGLDPRDPAGQKALASLRGGSKAKGSMPLYDGFAGSIGCEPETCERWVLSSRPSCGSFPSGTTGKLARLLDDLGWSKTTHVCDMYKFRGHGPDARADEDSSAENWELCLCILEREFDITKPKIVLVAGGKTQKWIQAVLEDRIKGRQGEFLKQLRGCIVPVPSWMAHTTRESLKREWDAAIKKRPVAGSRSSIVPEGG